MNMNTREKILVVLLAAVIILVGGYKLLVEPKLNQLNQLKADYTAAVAEMKRTENNRARAQEIADENERLEKGMQTAADAFFPSLQNDKIQVFFYRIADKLSLDFDSFTMVNTMITAVLPDTQTPDTLTYPAKDAADELRIILRGADASAGIGQKGGKAEGEGEGQTGLVEMMAVNLQFKADYEKTMLFLDELKNSGRLVRITSLNMTSDQEGGIAASISAECFGVEKIFGYDFLTNYMLPGAGGKSNPFQ